MELLYSKYFCVKKKEKTDNFCEKELLEQRTDERNVLESIYETAFTEKIKNQVWILSFKLNYLVNLFYTSKKLERHIVHNQDKRKKEKCKNYIRGNCKFGSKCRFSHEEDTTKDNMPDKHLFDYSFDLEIRFLNSSKYPYEAPLIFLKTNLPMPEQMNLHICKRLYQEAECLATDGMASIYTIAELLRNDVEITNFIRNNPIKFLSPNVKLFPKQTHNSFNIVQSSHYNRGTTNKRKQNVTQDMVNEDDQKLVKQLKDKVNEEKYKTMINYRKKLPAWQMKEEILTAIQNSKVVVISGETGCGKSTQVPQFILDEWLSNYNMTNETHVEIICTQPRRISAIGVAERVADERVERIGHSVGYQIRLEHKVTSITRLTFCTTGILLRRLELDPLLANVSHIIVDEVHERSAERYLYKHVPNCYSHM